MINHPDPATLLRIDAEAEIARIVAMIREVVLRRWKRKGAVIGVSGGVDSAVVAYLCARALGHERVFLLLLPEFDSSSESTRLGREVATALDAPFAVEDISSILSAAGCYERRDSFIREVIPDYGPDDKCKIVLPDLVEAHRFSLFSVIVRSPEGRISKARLTARSALGVVAATNFKQRTRKMMEYYYADLLQYAVAGTPNRLEYELGFFVKNGDGAADLKPIAHLYKTQVYQLAESLGVPPEIRERVPTTDTYSLEQTQEEFYFALPLQKMDLCLYGSTNRIPAAEVAATVGLTCEQVERVYEAILSRRRMAQYLQAAPEVVEAVDSTPGMVHDILAAHP